MMEKGGNACENILEGRKVARKYNLRDKEIEVLKGVDFTLRRGERVLIKGRSGAGKSTLLSLLAGLEPPTSGDIIFDGQNMKKLSSEEQSFIRRNKTGIIFQNFNLLPSWSACENVEAALFFTGLSRDEKRKKSSELLAKVGLGDRLDNLPAELSVGQQQRVAVVRALANEPGMIFADEPTGDVDGETAGEITDILFSWIRQRGASLLVVSHGDFPVDNIDRVLVLEGGVLSCPKQETE